MTELGTKVVKLILEEDKFNFELVRICAKYVNEQIEVIVETAQGEKSGNWCTQKEWNERTEKLVHTAEMLKELAEGNKI